MLYIFSIVSLHLERIQNKAVKINYHICICINNIIIWTVLKYHRSNKKSENLKFDQDILAKQEHI